MSAPVRMPERQDWDKWLRLRQELWPECAPDQHEVEMNALLADADRAAVFVVPSGEGLGGFVEVSLRPWAEGCESSPVAYVEGIFVAASERGRGVGRALLQAAEAWAEQRGCREIASDAAIDNERSRALHQRLGYEEREVLVHFRKPLVPGPIVEGDGE